MTVYSIHIFNKKCEAIYFKQWNNAATAGSNKTAAIATNEPASKQSESASDATNNIDVDGDSETAKLVYGVVFSLKNMVNKLSAGKNSTDGFLSYKTNAYKLHYFESPAGLKIVLITDAASASMLSVLRQIYSSIYVENVVKNPLAKPNTPIKNELFRGSLDKYIRGLQNFE
ncbi:TRAPP subunit bet5 [Physocladia obscura]|uniref:Trafficking protein particle complex subunit n=1 Tax=Physocladia obscura TaxID=109957 RepID=A0AAD5SWQ2_9FUNG|nr:TRAPP subunit bet5 [Physocladia obscura]